MKRLFLFALAIAAITLVGFWGGRKACMLMWPGSVNPQLRWYANLGLSPAEAEALKKQDAAFRVEGDRLCMRICRGRMELLSLLEREGVPEEEVFRKIEEIGAQQVLIEKGIAAHILAVRERLTPDQSAAYLANVREQLRESIRQTGYANELPAEGKVSL